MRTLVLVGLMAATLLGQGDSGGEAKKEEKHVGVAERELDEPGVKIEDPAVAREKLTQFEKAFKKEKDQFKKADLVKDLGEWVHPLIMKRAQKLARDKNRFVAIEGVFVCARQGTNPKVGKALHKLLKTEKRTDIVCALLVSMGKVGYTKGMREAEKYFRRDTKDTHLAATRYLGYIKAKSMFRKLAEKLDYPRPANANDPTNPPTAWWKERYDEWEIIVPHTQWALAQLVPGETFESVREAREWAQKHGKKHGVKW
ncbi:MAG: hypothetical protein V3T86_02745 [Planctomycetota bacterium]